jgi:tRNA A-37 threonylcarbamoyl transferase component Bud32
VPVDSAVWQQAMTQFQDLFSALRAHGIVHGDTKATNFLHTPAGLQVLDLDAMRQEPDARRFRRASASDLQRFARNFAEHPAQHKAVQAMLAQVLLDNDYDIHTQDKGA